MSKRMGRIGPIGPIFIALLMSACGESPSTQSSAPAPSTAPSASTPLPSPLNDFDEALRYVRNGGYSFIWVISRKDGKPLDKEDGAFLRTNAPQVVDWLKADKEGTKFIGGTNFNLEEGNLEALKKRFIAEDYSAK